MPLIIWLVMGVMWYGLGVLTSYQFLQWVTQDHIDEVINTSVNTIKNMTGSVTQSITTTTNALVENAKAEAIKQLEIKKEEIKAEAKRQTESYIKQKIDELFK